MGEIHSTGSRRRRLHARTRPGSGTKLLWTLLYVLAGLALVTLLVGTWASGLMRFLVILVFLPLVMLWQAKEWRRAREDRIERRRRWGLSGPRQARVPPAKQRRGRHEDDAVREVFE